MWLSGRTSVLLAQDFDLSTGVTNSGQAALSSNPLALEAP